MKTPASIIAVGAALALIAPAAASAAPTMFITRAADQGVQSAKQTSSVKAAAHPLVAVKGSTRKSATKSSTTEGSAVQSAAPVPPPRVTDIELPATAATPSAVTKHDH